MVAMVTYIACSRTEKKATGEVVGLGQKEERREMGQEEKVGSGWSWAAALSSPLRFSFFEDFTNSKNWKRGRKEKRERRRKGGRGGFIKP